MTRDSVITKLAKLKAKAESAAEIGNAEEAAIFTAKFQELMLRHELTMSEIEYAQTREDDPIDRQYVTDPTGKVNQRRKWQQDLAGSVARAFMCEIIVHPGSNSITFVGRESHRQCAVYVYTHLLQDLARLVEQEYDREWKACESDPSRTVKECRGFKAAYRAGFVQAIQQKVRAKIQEEKKRARQAKGESGVALIRIDNAEKAVREFMDTKLNLSRAGGLNGSRAGNSNGRRRGYDAGSRASIAANAVGSSGGASKQLGGGA